MAKPWPKHIRFAVWDDAAGSTPIALPNRRMWPVGLVVGVFFAIFAGVEAAMIAKAGLHHVRGVFDLMMFLFDVFWILGWSVAVLILGALTALLLLYRESARLQGGCLVHVPRLGPLKIVCRYELGRMSNVRAEGAGTPDTARVRFDYEGLSSNIGDSMPREQAEALVTKLRDAGAGATHSMSQAAASPTPEAGGQPERRAHPSLPPQSAKREKSSFANVSAIALIAANLLPVAGVLVSGWDLTAVVVLYWAESAVIGFYTILRMCVVSKLGAFFAIPFFLGHFGGFMAAHFAFIYGLFIHRGGGLPDTGALEELSGIFGPLWPALAALVVSHGISFVFNFLRDREYEGSSTSQLMAVPYQRIFVMHITVLLGGWIVLALGTPAPALVVLIAMKTGVDLRAHRRERAIRRQA